MDTANHSSCTNWTIDELNDATKGGQEVGDIVQQLVDGAILELTNADIHGSGSTLTNDELNRMRADAVGRLQERTTDDGKQRKQRQQ